jgi:hypothetical protein
MNKEPIQVKKSKDEILMQVCNITDKEEWSYVEHITPIQALKAMEEYRSRASDLPSDEEIEKEFRTDHEFEDDINRSNLQCQIGAIWMKELASPLLASHVARILELEEQLKSIQAIVDKGHKPEFDFEVEYWDSGNQDDSYSYGREVGEQYVFQDILKILTPKP